MVVRITEEEAKALGFVKDGKGNWKAGVQRKNSSKVPKLESNSSYEQKRSDEIQRKDARCSIEGHFRCRIVVTAYYRRHVDPDNICPKYFIDKLKGFGIIPDDSSKYVESFEKRVVVVENWEPEVTDIEVFELED